MYQQLRMSAASHSRDLSKFVGLKLDLASPNIDPTIIHASQSSPLRNQEATNPINRSRRLSLAPPDPLIGHRIGKTLSHLEFALDKVLKQLSLSAELLQEKAQAELSLEHAYNSWKASNEKMEQVCFPYYLSFAKSPAMP